MTKEDLTSFAKFTLKKAERLSSKTLIASLFEVGQSFYVQPFKILHLQTFIQQDKVKLYPIQLLITISKRNFPKAYQRNKIKRLVREAYRLHKQVLSQQLDTKNVSIAIAIIYTSKTITTFNEVENKIKVVLNCLSEVYEHSA